MPRTNTQKKNSSSFLHKTPKDVSDFLRKHKDVQERWDTLTPLARNEWICWITIVKKKETRKEYIVRMEEDILKGQKRPCCWPGCPHRRPSAQKWFNPLQKK